MSNSKQYIGNLLKKTAAILALFIGLMSVLVGSLILLGIDTKEYNILNWLVSYNVIFGVISIFAAYLICSSVASTTLGAYCFSNKP